MLMLAVQSLLLILAAFFAGAMIACFLRRVFFVRDNEHPAPDGGRKTQERHTETVTTTTTTHKTTKTQTVPPTEATRFGRALTGTAGAAESSAATGPSHAKKADMAAPAPKPTPEPDSLPEQDPLPEATVGVDTSAQSEQPMSPPAAPAAPPQSINDEEIETSATSTVAPVAKAAAEVATAAPLSPQAPTPSSAESEQPNASTAYFQMLRSVRSEALVGSPEPTAAGEDNVFRLPTAHGANVDDLKRIRGIGVLIEKKLNAMGVCSYEQIANWTAADVGRVSETLDFKGRIERESWIEQARILASGGYTEFSRRG